MSLSQVSFITNEQLFLVGFVHYIFVLWRNVLALNQVEQDFSNYGIGSTIKRGSRLTAFDQKKQ
jgi:hypothetical protein